MINISTEKREKRKRTSRKKMIDVRKHSKRGHVKKTEENEMVEMGVKKEVNIKMGMESESESERESEKERGRRGEEVELPSYQIHRLSI